MNAMDNHNSPLHVLLIYRRMIPSIRLCGHCQMQEMAEEGLVEYRAVEGIHLRISDMKWADIVLLGRLDSWYELQIVRMLKKAGKLQVYVIDDDLLNVPDSVSSAYYYNQKSIQGYIRKMMELSDALLSPSPRLLEKYGKDKRSIQIEEPAISPAPFVSHDPSRSVKIGFAGSIDRLQDLEGILKETLTEIKGMYGNRVVFEFFGALPSYAEQIGARCIPYTESYDLYRKTMEKAEWDIGLAPIPESPFHACKHYNKFIEYAAAGIVSVCSNVPPYDRLNAFPGCALLCANDAQEWSQAIRTLLDDSSLREEMRRNAAECAAGTLNVKHCGKQMLEELKRIPLREEGLNVSEAALLLAKCGNLFHRGKSFVIAHGVFGAVRRLVEKLLGRL